MKRKFLKLLIEFRQKRRKAAAAKRFREALEKNLQAWNAKNAKAKESELQA